jgi:hypothetical protein
VEESSRGAGRRAEAQGPARACFDCGAVLTGGMTEHKPDCSIRKLIEKNFGKESSENGQKGNDH